MSTAAGGGQAQLSLDSWPVPETLLVPLLEAAAGVLARIAPGDVPSVLRPLAGFDRRRLTTSGPARQQLRRAVDVDEEFRAQVVERFCEKPEVAAALDAWTLDQALERVADAAERADLALLASALYAARPRGWTFGLGMICAVADRERAEHEQHDDTKAWEVRLSTIDEARRRADDARDQALADVARLENELREERAGRRQREERASAQVEDAERRRNDAEALADRAVARADTAEARFEREAERARTAEHELRAAKRELDALATAATRESVDMQRADVESLASAAEDARHLAASLEGLTRRARDAVPATETAVVGVTPTVKRTRVPSPPGMIADTPEALDTMVRTRGVVLVVDGYNVSMAGWAGTPPAEQRERLLSALERLHLRVRCDVVVVFDGADIEGVPDASRPGVRVVFSADGEEADPLVVQEVAKRPKRIPVIVASSDQWVREHAEHEGATVVPATTLLDVLRR